MTLQILAKRACPPDDGPVLKRWKPELKWPDEAVTPPALQAELDVKLEVQEPTSVLDLQTSPGRSSSSSSGGSLSSQPSLSGDDTSNSHVAATSTDESVHNDHDIASWMECMEGGLALSDFAKCDDGDGDDGVHPNSSEHPSSNEDVTKLENGIEHLVNADIDFGFELGAFSMSDMMLADPELCLMDQFPEGFHDAHRLLELDESLSSMMKSQGFEAVESSSEVITVATEAPLDSGLQLVHLLLACAEAIDESDFETARPMLGRLKTISNPYGDPMQRIALYFADALSDRLEPQALPPSPSEVDKELAFQSFYEFLPFSKFTYLTANQAIFEAVGYHNKIHVVDLDIQQGLQWPSFLQTLAIRPGGSPHFHLTAVGTNAPALELTQRRLTEFAHALDVPFEFTIVLAPLQTLTIQDLHLVTDAALAVNCSHVLHTLTTAATENLLTLLRSLNPEVVTLLEVEANHNGGKLLSRFVEALHYYCALFDALEGTLARDSPDRFLIENTTCFAEIRGIVAQEDGHALKSETWEKVLTKCGFRSKPLSSYSVQQAQLLLAYFASGDHATPYKLSEECGALIMGWQETPVMAVSSWSC